MSYGYKAVSMSRLIQRRRRLLEKLPALDEALRGSLVERAIRCGKPSCRCARGELHSATYLSVTHRGGQTEQVSIPARLVPRVREGIGIYAKWREILEKVSTINRELLRQQRGQLRGRGGGADGARKGITGRRSRRAK